MTPLSCSLALLLVFLVAAHCLPATAAAIIPTAAATPSLSSFPLAQQLIRQHYLTPAYLATPTLPTYPTSTTSTHPTPADCPCANATLCQPLTVPDRAELFVFQVRLTDWQLYNWTRLTTIVATAGVDPALLCYAHARSVRLVTLANYPAEQMGNATARREWVGQQVAAVQAAHLDGVNVDFEDALNATAAAGYTALIAELSSSLHAAVAGSQVSVDVAWSPSCIDGRCYDAAGLAKAADLLFVMSYDLRSQVYNLSDCVAAANSPLPRVAAGLHNYTALAGVPAYKLVLGVPFYLYDYPCLNSTRPTDRRCDIARVPFRGAPCSDAAGKEYDYADYAWRLQRSTTGRRWDAASSSWWFNYVDSADGVVHQVWYDDVHSLRLKYALVGGEGLRGVGMWTADNVNYTLPLSRETRDMWAAVGDAAAQGTVGDAAEAQEASVQAE